MNDTKKEVARKMAEMIQQKTPEERLKMGCSMYETSKYLVTRAILEQNPQITESELRKELFLKFYGDDFDLKTQDKIINYLTRNTKKSRSKKYKVK